MEINPNVYLQGDRHRAIAPPPLGPPEITFPSSTDVNHPSETESLTNLLKDASHEHLQDRDGEAETEELSSKGQSSTGEESSTAILSEGESRLDDELVTIENEGGGLTFPEDNGRERLKRHRLEVAGSVWIPEIWGQEELLKDLIDCSAFDASLVPGGILSARSALIQEGRRANSGRLRIENRC